MSKRGRPISDEAAAKRKRILRMVKQEKFSLAEIGESVGVSKQYVSSVIKTEGGEAPKARRDVSDIIRIIVELGGFSYAEIAAMVGANRSNFYRWANGRLKASREYATRLERVAEGLKRASDLLK
jgi:transcriptional regulator with XRE-family HTH domain